MSVTMRIDLQKFLRRLNDDLWAIGNEEGLGKIVVRIHSPGLVFHNRHLISQSSYPDMYYMHPPPGVSRGKRYTWTVSEGMWQVVKVSKNRYPNGLKTSILVHPIEGT